MPTPEVLKNLDKSAEGNTYKSLTDTEKLALQQLNVDDLQKQKDELGKIEFTVGGKKMPLSEIVKKFDTATNKVDGTKIAVKSDLAAAIQVYVLACGGSISANPTAYIDEAKGIDGFIGKDTKGGIADVQTVVTADIDKKGGVENSVDQDEVKEQNIYRLANAIYTEYVGKYKDKKYELLNTRPGIDQGALRRKEIEGNNIRIKYKSGINETYQSIIVDASTCKTGTLYSVNKFGKAIEEAITEKENELKEAKDKKAAEEKLNAEQKAIIANIESVGVGGFPKKIQAYFREKGYVDSNGLLDFQEGRGRGITFANNGNLKFGNAFSLYKREVDGFYTSGKFDVSEFQKTVSNKVDTNANLYFRGSVNVIVSSLEKTTVTQNNLQSVKQKIKEIEKIIGFGVDVGVHNKQILEMKRNEVTAIENQRENERKNTEMQNTIIQGVESFDTGNFSPKIQDYLREKKYLSTFGNTMDFHTGIGTGIEFDKSGNLKLGNFVTIPKDKIGRTYLNNKFNQKIFKTYAEGVIFRKIGEELKSLVGGFGEININTLTAEEKKLNEAKKLTGKIDFMYITGRQEIKAKLEKRTEEIKDWKDFKEVSEGVDKKITEMIDSLNNPTSPNSIFDKRNKLANFHNDLKDHKATYNEKNIYDVYIKVNGGDKYDKLIKRVRDAVPQVVELK